MVYPFLLVCCALFVFISLDQSDEHASYVSGVSHSSMFQQFRKSDGPIRKRQGDLDRVVLVVNIAVSQSRRQTVDFSQIFVLGHDVENPSKFLAKNIGPRVCDALCEGVRT